MAIKLANLVSSDTISGGLPYFEYEFTIARDILVPWLQRRMTLEGATVGDFGCHQGGILEGLRQVGKVKAGVGYDLDEPSIRISPFVTDDNFRLEVGDVTQLDASTHRFDLILIRDVLEHIPDHVTVLEKARECLTENGRIFISFPPYYSPFGGHQQEAANWTRCVPFLHYLPEALFFRLIETRNTLYMSAESSLGDIRSVVNTRMTLAKAESAFKKANLKIAARESFLLRPEFKVRYGLPALNNGPLAHLPILREICTMGVYYLLQA